MAAFLLQDFVTIKTNSSTPVTQGENGYLDLGAYDDIVFYLLVSEVSGVVNLSYQSGISKDDAAFQNMVPALTVSAGQTVTMVLWATAYVPLLRWVRWQISSPTSVDTTFRIWIAASSLGGA